MKKRLIATFGIAFLLTEVISSKVSAIESDILTVKDGITLLDKSGNIYIHMQNKGALYATVDKTEPEGVFCYYTSKLINTNLKAEKSYIMPLSCCEYLIDSGDYASYYTINISSAMDKNATYGQNIVIKDPGFENIKGSEYHFYITMKPSSKSEYKISASNEYTSDDDKLICEQYIEIYYSNKGDVTSDGEIDISDATAALTIYAKAAAAIGTSEFSESQKEAADIDGDGKVDISDATEILTIYAKSSAGLE